MNTQHMMQQTLSLLGGLLLAFSVQAQTVYWGVGSTNGVAAAEFQNNFVQAGTFVAGDNPTAWTALSISDNSGNTVPGAAYWVRSTTGVSQGAYATNMTAVPSPSQANGVALFDSDFLDNNGTRLPAGAGTGTSPSDQRAELISPRIDLSSASGVPILVEFFCQYRPFNVTEWSMAFSTDDGISWTNVTDVRSLLAGTTNATSVGTIRWLLPNVTAGGNLSQCRLKFTFEGQYYYYILDDISIQEAPAYDIAIGEADPDAGTYFTVGNIVRMGGGNAYIAYDNLDFNAPNPINWSWGAKVVNGGYREIVPSQGARLICKIDHLPNNSSTTNVGIFYDTIAIDPTDTIKVSDRDGVAFVKELSNLNFIQMQNNPAGEYFVTYWAEHDSTDGSGDNDTIRHSFFISDATNNSGSNPTRRSGLYSSKARLGSDGRAFRGGSIFPGGAPHTSFEYGSLFYFPFGATDNVTIDSIDFRYYLRSGFTGAASQTVFANVYRFQDGTNGAAANGFITGDELTLVGFSPLVINGLGTTYAAGDYHLATFTNMLNPLNGQPMGSLADGAFYYVSILIHPAVSGGMATFGANDVPTHAVDRLNYAMNIGMTSTAEPFAPSTMNRVDAQGTENWFAGFTGFDEVPSIGLFTSHDGVISTQVLPNQEESTLSVYPNPVSSHLTIDWKWEGQPTNVQYIMTDATGRVVYLHQVDQVNQDLQQVDVSDLPSGIYFISARAEGGVSTQRFIKE